MRNTRGCDADRSFSNESKLDYERKLPYKKIKTEFTKKGRCAVCAVNLFAGIFMKHRTSDS